MEILNVTYKCKKGMREKFLETIKEEGLDTASRSEAGNIKYDFYFGVHNLKNRDSMFEKMLLERLKYIKNSDAEKFNDKIKEEIKIINDYFKKTI